MKTLPETAPQRDSGVKTGARLDMLSGEQSGRRAEAEHALLM